MSTRRISLFAGWAPFVLGVLWMTVVVALYVFIPEGNPRKSSWAELTGVALMAAPPLAVLALAIRRNAAGFRGWAWGARAGNAALLAVQWIAWLFLYFLLPALWMPSYAKYTVRAQLSEVLLGVSGHRTAVTEALESPGGLATLDRTFQRGKRIDAGFVGDDGVIAAYNNEFGALVVLVPVVNAGRLAEWKCEGFPPRFMPASCRAAKGSSFSDRHAASIEEDAAALKRFADALDVAAPATSRVLPPSAVFDFGYHGADGAIALYSDRTGVFLLKTASGCTLWPGEAKRPGCASGARRGD